MAKPKVLLRRCEEYDPQKIAGIIGEGMEELGVTPSGRVLLKPNVVIAHPEIFPYAFTRAEFLEGAILATKARAFSPREIAVGERSGITLPTRYNFRNAGYTGILRRHRIKTYYFDEVKQVPVAIKNQNRLRDQVFVPKPVKDCDFLINLPKFKAHPWCRLTLSLKNFIGLQDDRHRLVDHNLLLEQKIADLQEVIQPGFIAIDAITAGQRMMLTPTPFDMGAILMGTNSCAVDTVGCHMVHVDPLDLVHLRLAAERGFGPLNLAEIELAGDLPLAEVQENTRDFGFCLERVDDYFMENSALSCTVGRFPARNSPDYCWGGCPGALQEAVHILRGVDPHTEQKMRKIRYVVGNVEGPLDLDPDERVLFAGDCTRWRGKIDGAGIQIRDSYKGPAEVDEEKTKSNDMLLKILGSLLRCLRKRSARYLHAPGCPVSVAEHVNYLSFLGKVTCPNFNPRLALPLNLAYIQMRIRRFLNRFRP
jgi:uncharacterized protein (DUF362 family)